MSEAVPTSSDVMTKGKKVETKAEKETWSNPAEFFLTLVAYTVGPGNILRFPYLCMRFGGGVFLVPYIIFLFLCGAPLFLLEMVMGQSTQRSCIGCWDVYGPLFRGFGYTMFAGTAMGTFYLQTYMGWILFYFSQSFTLTELPWTTCNATWNTPNCILTSDESNNQSSDRSYEIDSGRGSNYSNAVAYSGQPMGAAEEYFQYETLRLSSGIDVVGSLSWELTAAHSIGWLIMVFCLIKGIKTAGKVVWFSATLPYLLITILIIRAALLPGFMDGIYFYITPDFEKLKNPEVWMMAFVQISYTIGPGWGGVPSMASFNKYHHNLFIEAVFCPIICALTSFFAGFATFGAAGYLAYKKGLPVEQAISSGPGLAFVTYPELAAHLPGGPIWAALFFFMMFTVLLDTLLVMIETVVAAISDSLQLKKRQQKYVLLIYAALNMVLGLIFYTQAGMYFFQLMDWYCVLLSIFLGTAAECLCVMWVYGYKRFYDDIYDMTGRRPLRYLLIPMWSVVIPALLLTALVWSVTTLSKPRFGDYVFPDWAANVGWTMAFSAIAPAVIYALVKTAGALGDEFPQKMRALLRPKWRPTDMQNDIECHPMNQTNDTADA